MQFYRLFYLLIFSFLGGGFCYGQVANDNCNSAQNIGQLPTPANCNENGTGGQGTVVSVNGTNRNASVEADGPPGILNCNNAPQPIPASDVWFKFIASGNTLNIRLNAQGITKPTIAIWTGDCGNLVPIFCHSQSGANIDQTINSLAPGNTYYIQVHGEGTQDQGDFSMNLLNENSCDVCVLNTRLTVNPQPINGTYTANQTVEFCFSIDEFKIVANNWLHGVVPRFGSAWDLSTLEKTPAKSCYGDGEWGWYNSVRSNVTNQLYGPGFFYESTGAPNNPGDNFGDRCEGDGGIWEFCWRITTKQQIACEHGSDLGIVINTFSDGESGAWDSPACSADPDYIFVASQDCCDKPQANATPSCEGNSTGEITVNGSGTSPWIYTLRAFDGSELESTGPIAGSYTFENLAPATYFAYAEDAEGCSKFSIVNVNSTKAPTISIESEKPLCTGQCNGSATVIANGGTPPYFAEWSTGESGLTANQICGGEPTTVTFTDNAGCLIRESIVVNDPPKLQFQVSTFENVTCANECNGEIDLTGSGGTLPYSVLWSDGNEDGFRTDLCPNKRYNITLTDNSGCEIDTFIQTADPPKYSVSSAITDEECKSFNGQINLTVSGAAPPYNFLWSDGARTEDRQNIASGFYGLTITDAENCNFIDTLFVNRFSNIDFSATIDNVSCFQGTDGKITASSNTANPPFQLTIDSVRFKNPLDNLEAGDYLVYLIDANSCIASKNITITEPDSIIPNEIIDSASCFLGSNDGGIRINPSGGNGNFQFNWSNGNNTSSNQNLASGSYSVTLIDQQSCNYTYTFQVPSPPPIQFSSLEILPEACLGDENGSVSGQILGGNPPIVQYNWNDGSTNFPRNNLSPGLYNLSVEDSKGCKADTIIRIESPPSEFLVDYSVSSSIQCFGDSSAQVTISATGGVSPYSVIWPDGNNQFQRNQLAGGNYQVSVTDDFACERVLSIIIDQPAEILSNPSIQAAICTSSVGSIQPNISGGTPNYNYQWSNGSSASSISNLEEGDYQLTITDKNNCQKEFSYTIQNEGFIIANPKVDSITCEGYTDGRIEIDVENGRQPFQFSWSNGQSTQSINNLGTGNYSVTVSDADGCIDDTSASIFEPAPPIFGVIPSRPTCFGDSDGSLELIVLDNVQTPIEIDWIGYGQVNPLDSISAGEYFVKITDSKDCVFDRSFFLDDAIEIIVNAGPDKKVYENSTTGFSIKISPKGNNYDIRISPESGLFETNDTTFQVVLEQSQQYIIEVENELGCLVFDTLNIELIDQNIIILPSGFSPNNDGQNDIYSVYLDFPPNNFRATIMNRWGNVVYRTQDPKINWSGKLTTGKQAELGVYIILVEFNDPSTGERIIKSNQLTLVR